MDGEKFDDLIRRLATVQVTRLNALRGLVATAAAALTGTSLLDETEAKKKAKADAKQREGDNGGKKAKADAKQAKGDNGGKKAKADAKQAKGDNGDEKNV